MTKTGKQILIFAALLAVHMSPVHAQGKEVNPSMDTKKINRILNSARPGDTIIFLAGSYTGPFVLEDLHGSENLPLVIMGIRGREGNVAEIDGLTKPGMYLKQHAFLLRDCSWISIENFDIRNCWTDLIRAENTSYLSIRYSNLYGGKRALFATGRESHHFFMEHCQWEQDERIWTHAEDYSWDEIHHGVHRHYNGSLFQGSGISGVIVLRDNEIRNTFNAFRLSQINDGTMDPLACSNVEIYRNRIINTSDNVLEPEVHALNLHYYHNQMINGHAFVSITEVAGGDIYIYGNTAVSLPGSEDGWTIFKISSEETGLTRPLYIYNNSWQVDFDVIGSPRHVWKNNHLRHFNNACFSETSDTFGIYDLGAGNHFDFDCSNVPFPALLTSKGFETNGIVADPLFRDPYNNDFKLQANSPCIDRGTHMESLIANFEGKGPDIGAYDNGKLIEGPAFRYVESQGRVPFLEMPRITKYSMKGNKLTLWFSVPLDKAGLASLEFGLSDGKASTLLEFEDMCSDDYGVVLSAKKELKQPSAFLTLSGYPLGKNGKALTSWASVLPLKIN